MKYHIPVLNREMLGFTQELPGGRNGPLIVDATLGDGGHSLALLSVFEQAQVLGFDRDIEMLVRAKERFAQAGLLVEETEAESFYFPKNAKIVLCRSSYHKIAELLEAQKLRPTLILLDLGVSLYHLKAAQRGFSYLDDTLDMRFDTNTGIPAHELVNHSSQKELQRIFRDFGEEPYAHRLSKAIIEARPFFSAHKLAECIRRKYPPLSQPRHRRIHPATRIFQALRIAVNTELDILASSIQTLPPLLAPGGLLFVISFHSLEDRIVKHGFRYLGIERHKKTAKEAPFLILTRRPVRPSLEEVKINPAARSARLRVLYAQRGT